MRDDPGSSDPSVVVQQALAGAMGCFNSGDLVAAENICRTILARRPDQPVAMQIMGLIAHRVGQNEMAIQWVKTALAIDPGYFEAMNNLGCIYRAMDRWDEAAACWRQAIMLRPDYAEALNNLGAAHERGGEVEEATSLYRRALAAQAGHLVARFNLGNALLRQGEIDEAIECFQAVCERQPAFADAHVNLGNARRQRKQFAEAMACYRRAIAIDPALAEAHHNLAVSLRECGNEQQAIVCWRRAVALRPDYPEAHLGLGMALLLQGNFAEGWGEYEWRWRNAKFCVPPRDFLQPRWDGSDLSNRTLFVHAEQGLGDTLQFVRFVPRVGASRIILECEPSLAGLLRASPNLREVEVLARAEPGEHRKLPDFDVHVPLLSLAFLLGVRQLDDIPNCVPYLYPVKSVVEEWRARVPADPRLKVGLVWAGSGKNANDHRRSIPLKTLDPLARDDVVFYSLQAGPPASQAHDSASRIRPRDFSGELSDFAQTAALISQLDLVISVDTATAHLAGAMGKPTWVLIPAAPDFRWLLHREDSPWYPTMRLFRQRSAEDWDDPIERMAAALNDRALRER